MFPFSSCLYNWGKNSVLKPKTLNLFQNNHVNFCLYFFVKLSVYPCIFYQTLLLCFNQGLLLNQSISLAALEVKCVRYLHSLPIHLLISLFLVICFERPITWTPDNSNFFWFPEKVWVIGSRLYMFYLAKSIIDTIVH